jgi:outer membrane protein TolC
LSWKSLVFVLFAVGTWAQTNAPLTLGAAAQGPAITRPGGTGPTRAIPLTVSLQDAIRLAQANASQFRAAVTEAGLAHENTVQARAALLPGVSYATSAILTQPNGTPSGVFIASNAPNEYTSWGAAHEALSLAQVSDYRRVRALEAVARADLQIAQRGLVTTVVTTYYGMIVARDKLQNAQAAADEAQRFLNLSRQLQQGGEVANSDVVKAQLQANDAEVAVEEARVATETAKLGLAVLIFPNFTQNFDVVNDLDQIPLLPDFAQAQALAGKNSPEIAAATEVLRAAQHEVTSTIGDRLPSLTIDSFYGIDATRYAVRTDHINNLGYSVVATLNVPVFDWGALRSRTKQARLQRDLAQVQLSETQRAALANLQIFYHAAEAARGQVGILKQSVDLATESLRLTTLRYQSGEATALEVVDAQNALALARNNYDDIAARCRTAIAQLQTLTGTF